LSLTTLLVDFLFLKISFFKLVPVKISDILVTVDLYKSIFYR
jgi:hypothetical protein